MFKLLRRSLLAQVIVTAIVVLGPSVYLVASAAPAEPARQLATIKSDAEAQRKQVTIRPAKVSLAARAKEWLYRSVGRNSPRPVNPTS